MPGVRSASGELDELGAVIDVSDAAGPDAVDGVRQARLAVTAGVTLPESGDRFRDVVLHNG